MAKKFVLDKHILVPKHSKLSEKDKKALLEKYKITFKELPKILYNDAALANMEVSVGDVIKIERVSPTAGKSIYYRGVSNE